MAARGFIGAGDIYIARFTGAGVPGPLVYAGDASRFEIKPNSTLKERKSRGRDTYGQVVETVGLQEPADFAMTLSEPNRENLALALMGTVTTTAVAATPVTNEAITAELGRDVPLARQNLATAGVAVTNEAGTTTYVDGTDYVVNHRLGTVRALNGGAITDGQVLHVDYTPQAGGESVILGAVEPSLRARILFDGVNVADRSQVICHVWETVLTPSSAVDLLRDDWMEIELGGRMKTPTGRPAPFEMRFFTPTP